MEKELISIILPVYNGQKYLSRAIESCLNQTYKNIELIIVNDCSTDKTLEMVKSYANIDSRIKIINNKVNKKLPTSLNIGHQKACGNFITWTSHDNILKENFIERLLDSLIKKNIDVIYSDYDVINEDGTIKRINESGSIEHQIFGNQIGASFMYRKKVFWELNGYNENLYLLEDFDFWLRASFKYNFFHLKENIYQYRLHNNSLTTKIQNNIIFNQQHKEGIISMYSRQFDELGWNNITKNLLIDIFFRKSNVISDFLLNKEIIKNDFMKIESKYLNKEFFFIGLRLKLRNELMVNKQNHNLYTLLNILINDRKLLFYKDFSNKRTLIFILKSVF